MDEEQKEQFDSWTKLSIYEAYLTEHETRKRETERANEYLRKIKRIEWELLHMMRNFDLNK